MRLLELVFSSRKRPATARAQSLSAVRVAICLVLLGAMIASTAQSVSRALLGPFPDRCSAYHSSDAYLQALTGAPNASQRVVNVMTALPKDKPLIVFEREGDSGSFLGMILAYLSWPRDVRIQVIEGNQCARQLEGIRPDSVAAVAFCDLPTPEWIHGGIRLGQTIRLLPVRLPNDRLP